MKAMIILDIFFSYPGSAQAYARVADRPIDAKDNEARNSPTIIVSRGRILEINFTRGQNNKIAIGGKGNIEASDKR